MKNLWMASLLAVGGLMTASSAQAGFALGTPTAPPTANITGALTGFSTSGDDMVGMSVTAFFAAGGSESVSWAATGSGAGGVTGTGWSLSESGDTFTGTWILSAASELTRLVIDALPGRTVFDMRDGSEFTPGSALGKAMSSVTGDGGYSVVGTYRNLVGLNGTFHGDLYGTLDIEFDRGYAGTLTWVSDTDNATADSRIDPVPEPASILVWSLSALGLAYGRRRNKLITAA